MMGYFVAVGVSVGGIPPGGVGVNGEGSVGDGAPGIVGVIVGCGEAVGVTRLARTVICCPTKILF